MIAARESFTAYEFSTAQLLYCYGGCTVLESSIESDRIRSGTRRESADVWGVTLEISRVGEVGNIAGGWMDFTERTLIWIRRDS